MSDAVMYPASFVNALTLVGTVGMVGLFLIYAGSSVSVSFQFACTCAAGMLGLFLIYAGSSTSASFQSLCTCDCNALSAFPSDVCTADDRSVDGMPSDGFL